MQVLMQPLLSEQLRPKNREKELKSIILENTIVAGMAKDQKKKAGFLPELVNLAD